MNAANPYGIQNIGSIAESSDATAPPPPRELLRVSFYQQPPGCHPGQPPGLPPRRWALPPGREVVELVTGGRGWVRSGDAWVEVRAGALIWHVAGDQTIGASDWAAPYRCLAVAFRVGRARGRRADRISWWPEPDAVERFSRELLHGLAEGGLARETLLHYAYGRLLYESHRGRQRSPEWPEPLRRAIAWLEAHAAGPCPVEEVAREAGWSLAHLHAVFRERLGVTPHQFVLERRLRIAREWLALTQRPIKQIAVEAGFGTAAAFCRTFRARVGLTPQAYRQREQAGGRQD